MRSKGVGLFKVKRFAAYHDVLHSVFAVHACKHGIFILRAAAFNVGVDLIGETGNLQEAAEFTRNRMRAPFQRIQDLLTGHFDYAHGIAERMYLQDFVQCHVASFDVDADAATVDKCDVGAGLVAVCIGAEIAEIGFGAADNADRLTVFILCGRIEDCQIDSCLCDNLSKLLVQLCGCILNFGCHAVGDTKQLRRRNIIAPGVNAGAQCFFGICRDLQPADAAQLGAAGGTVYILPILVLHHNLVGVMAVTVKKCIKAGGVLDHIHIGPGLALSFVAHVSHNDDIIGAFRAGTVNSGLYRIINAFAGFILQEAVDEIAILILEILRCGGGERLRRGYTHKRDLDTIKFLNHIGIKYQLAFFVEVAADVRELRHVSQLEEALHAIVEFMVAGDGNIVVHVIHQLDIHFARGHGAQRLTLDGIAVVNQQGIVAGCLQVFPDGLQAYIAEALVNTAVYIAREQDNQILLQSLRRSFCFGFLRENRHGAEHAERQQ